MTDQRTSSPTSSLPPPPPPSPPPRRLAPAPAPAVTQSPTLSLTLNSLTPSTPPPNTPANARLVQLLIYNGWPFADHWEYFIPDHSYTSSDAGPVNPDFGTRIQAAGNVRDGFWLEVHRGWDLGCARDGNRPPDGRVGLAWVKGELFESFEGEGADGEGDGHGNGHGDERGERRAASEREPRARCRFEQIVLSVPAPERSLRAVHGHGHHDGEEADAGNGRRKKITQRNCQWWIIESAERLLKEGIFDQRVPEALRAAKQY
ncbi:hypothetical protein N656DRAFT_823982 [Canariomyces notabilis]|uniref:Uncharacterized protein n=1 Tax=Canariomyces notabilis TaxID=2074819 RepID=A0AAN6TFU8_9PEZI|nr:hypothetical protein N656DRAFT_823982 [Canariomyces arenarius]